MGDRVEAILKWLRDLSAWWSKEPVGRLNKYVTMLNDNWDKIYYAIREAMVDELKEYAETVATLIRGEAPPMAESTTRGEDTDNEGDTKPVHGGSEEESEGSRIEILDLAEERGRSDNIPLDVQGEIQGDYDRHSILHTSGDREAVEGEGEGDLEK